ncbi:MAG TPA: HAMP domain-containing sensor histidine kinase [Candidatus Eisenbacteria bacterium]|nr:HAMP domain-containing sensor histidine kinase [Candidatus Eisenbacteria bacterium]
MKLSIPGEQHRAQQIRKLTEVSRALTYAATLEEVFELTVARAADLLAAEKALLLVADDDGLLSMRASHGVGDLSERFHEPLSEKLVPRLTGLLGARPECFLGVPLVVAGAIKGLLVVIRSTSSVGSEEDEWILSALADQAAAALERSRLDEIGEFREQLIGIISHDLRSPLNTIHMGATILLQRPGLGEMETEVARKIARSSVSAVRLIDQLLDLTRSRLGAGISIDPKRFDLTDVCRQVIGETELTHPDRPLRVDVQGDLTGVWDRDRIYQLLANLVGNAVQHGEPRSAIDLRIDGGETEVLIEVTNRGAPIPPAVLPFIFEAFRRVRTAHRSQSQGLGLGLFIAQEIARLHGGSIAVTSESEGTTFRVLLPRDATAPAPVDP